MRPLSLLGTISFVCVVAIGAGIALAPATAAGPRKANSASAAHPRRPSPLATPNCSSSDALSFVGVPASNVAAGFISGVVAGESNNACGNGSAIVGGTQNQIGINGGGLSSTIGGGASNDLNGAYAFLGSGQDNEVTSDNSFVGAGSYNDTDAAGSFIGAGGYEFAEKLPAGRTANSVTVGTDSFIGGGDLNEVDGNGGFIGGGGFAFAQSGGATSGNQVIGTDSFVGAGDQNVVSGVEAAIGGGQGNAIGSKANEAFIGGGAGNAASGSLATIPGGYHNSASGTLSFAAGYGSDANTNGSFVWSDYSPGTSHLVATVANQFLVRASGGVEIFSDSTMKSGVRLAAGSGSWSNLSDRSMKTGVVAIDDSRVLDKLAKLPVSEWSYTTERGVRHVGPMAQDFYAAFGVGEDDRHIASIDEDGVALAAIKALHAENQRLRVDNQRLHAANARLDAESDGLRQRMARHDASVDARLATLERALQMRSPKAP